MARPIKSGHEFAADLCRAVGVDPLVVPVKKIVIEAEVGHVTTVYLKTFGTVESAKKICDLVAVFAVDEVEVADDCTVTSVNERVI